MSSAHSPPGARPPSRTLCVVTHTHWDREWYRSAAEFRRALVDLIDEALDDGPATHLLLDGQAMVLEDYLAVRPERTADLARALAEGRIEGGPWYVLSDNLIPGGEALVRNLLAGRAVLRRLRATPPPVLYSPDAFGHPAFLPELAAGFAMPVAIVWRGYGGAPWPAGDSARWRGAGGASVLLHHLAPDGYELGSNLPADEDAMRARWNDLRTILAPRATLGVALLPNGADHHAVQRHLPDAIAALRRVVASGKDGEAWEVETTTLAGTAARLVEAAASHTLPVVHGELRESPGYTWALQGTFGVRAAQKRRNAQVERLLVHEAEPWSALARWHDGTSRRHHVAALWRDLLACHPHDTLCGCSIDAVARAMDQRLEEVERAATLLARREARTLLDAAPDETHIHPDRWHPVVVVRNAAARPRGGVCEIELDEPVGVVPAGPHSAPGDAPPSAASRLTLAASDIPLQALGRSRAFVLEESPRHYPRNTLVQRRRLLAWIPPVGGYTVRTFALRPGRERRLLPSVPVTAEGETIDNGRLCAWVDAHDGLCVSSHDGRLVRHVLQLESVGDRGDLYTHSPIPGSYTQGEIVGHRLVARGPLRATLRLTLRLTVPAHVVQTATGEEEREPARVVVAEAEVSLDAGSDAVRLTLRGTNTARNHRLRVVLHGGVSGTDSWGDAASGVVHRPPRRWAGDGAPSAAAGERPATALALADAPAEFAAAEVPPAEIAPADVAPADVVPAEVVPAEVVPAEVVPASLVEAPSTTHPLHRYVSCFDAAGGFTVVSDGLAEYERQPTGAIAVTLLRAVGELSRNTLPERPGHAGWPAATPMAQALAPFEGRFALFLHGGATADTLVAIERAAEDFLAPLTGDTWLSAVEPPVEAGGIELEGEGVFATACKESEDGTGLVLRCRNQLDHTVAAAWHVPGMDEAWLARLDETPLGALPTTNDRVRLDVPAHAIVTVIVRRSVSR